jgi:hypothetical protein
LTPGPGRDILSRRELLKLSLVVLAGAFAMPKLRDYLLEAGVAFSDRVAGATFRSADRAPTFADSLVVPFDKFPYNGLALGSVALGCCNLPCHP